MRKWYLITMLGLMWTLVASLLWLAMYIQWATNSLPLSLAQLVMPLVGDGYGLGISMLVAAVISLTSLLILLLRYGKPRKGRPQRALAVGSAAPAGP